MSTVYTRHPDLRLTVLDDEGVVLHLGLRRYFSVNETGVLILNALEEPRTLAQLITKMTDEYDVTADLAKSTALEFLDRCIESELVRAEG